MIAKLTFEQWTIILMIIALLFGGFIGYTVGQIINDITIKEPPTYGYAMTIEEKKKKKSEKLRQKYLKRSIKRNKEVI